MSELGRYSELQRQRVRRDFASKRAELLITEGRILSMQSCFFTAPTS
jgi:hypothetical protein